MTRPSVLPLTATKSNIDRCRTSSHSPTPPACGQTRTPNLAASRRIDILVHSADPGGVDLQDVEGAGAKHLLEDDAVGDVLTGRDEHRGDTSTDRGVAEDIVGAGRLLDPVRVELGELVDPLDGLGDLPSLVGVNGDRDVRADGSARDRHPSDILFEVATDLELDEREAVLDSLD